MDMENKDGFHSEIYFTNIKRAKYYGIGFVVIHLILIYFDIRRLFGSTFSADPVYRYIFYFHLAVTAVLLLFLAVLYLLRLSVPKDVETVHKAVFIAFALFLLLSSTAASVIDQIISGWLVVYILGILSLAAAAYLPLLPRFLLFVPVHILLLLGLLIFQGNRDLLISHVITGTIVFFIAVSISQIMYQNRQKTFLAGQIVRNQQKVLENMSLEDRLTGLRNRRYIDTKMMEEWDRAVRYDRELGIAVLGADRYELFKTTFGLEIGDEVLREIGVILRGSIRGVDAVARFSGEEFLMLFPETDKKQAAAISEKVRKQTETYPWNSLHSDLKITVSVGVAGRREADTMEAFLSAARTRLRAAREKGGNLVVTGD